MVAMILTLSPAAGAAARVSISASVDAGAAPLRVAFTAAGDAASYRWDFGDGTAGDGAAVEHVYGPGAFIARVTATSATGETTVASARVRSYALRLQARSVVSYGGHLGFRGVLVPGDRKSVV